MKVRTGVAGRFLDPTLAVADRAMASRNIRILAEISTGRTGVAVGREFGLSHERIRQIWRAATGTGLPRRRAKPKATAFSLPKTHCAQGHPFTGDNLFVQGGQRRCRECCRRWARESARRRYAARKAAR
jgi:hypothetical protein